MMEKYLNDTIRAERLAKVEEIAAANLLPPYFERLQYIEDSTRAERWSEITGDSTRLKKYLRKGAKPPAPAPKKTDSLAPNQIGAVLPDKKNPVKSLVNRSR
jgi:penicillin-binding protein 2